MTRTTQGTKTDGYWDVPLDRDGNMLSWPQGWSEPTGEVHTVTGYGGNTYQSPVYQRVESPMVAMPPFHARFRLVSYERGRSAARFILKNLENGKTYPVFFDDFFKMLMEEGIEFEGRWQTKKSGQNYAIERTSK